MPHHSNQKFFRMAGMFILFWSVMAVAEAKGQEGMPRFANDSTNDSAENILVDDPCGDCEDGCAWSPPTSLAESDPLSKAIPQPNQAIDSTTMFVGSVDGRTKKQVALVVGSLAIVVAGFMLITMLFGKEKRASATSTSPVEVLCQKRLSKHQQLQLIRLGQRLLLVSNSDQRTDTLAEIVDPTEIAEIEQQTQRGDLSFFGRNRTPVNRSARTLNATPRRQPVYEA